VQQVAPALDPDAEAFLLAAGITDATITSAINNLVLSLKADSIWAKMTALYPLVGGTASTHKFNLKDPRDLDAAFRLTFVGSPTHDANGVQGNGTSQCANTHLNNNTIGQNSLGMFLYSRTNQARNEVDMGVFQGAPPSNGSEITSRWSDTNYYGRNQSTFFQLTGGFGRSDGFIGNFRSSSTNVKLCRNTTISDVASNSNTPINELIALMAWKNLTSGTFQNFTSKQYGFFGVTDGITSDTEINNLNTIIANFQTALSRNV
jgi:hypothetical protein